jgi:hypothetical protein
MQIVVAAVPAQEAITRDNVTLKVDAVVYYRVIDPLKVIINVQDYAYAVSQVAQTSLRSVIGQSDMDQLLSERDKVNAHLKDVIDAPTEEPWASGSRSARLRRTWKGQPTLTAMFPSLGTIETAFVLWAISYATWSPRPKPVRGQQ